MKKALFLLGAAMLCTIANAQVTRGTVGNASYTNWENQTETRMGLDFNNDGVNEFALNNGYDMNTGDAIENGAVEYVFSSTNNVHTDAEMWDYFKLLNSGDVINVASGFNGQGDCYFEDYTAIGNCAYVGFRIQAGGMCYGYAKVSFNGTSVNWEEIFYNATPSAAITVGETGNGGGEEPVGINQAEANHFIAAAMGNHQLNIVQDQAETINVYDIAGRKVATVNSTNSTITLPAEGIYILRSATTSAKILVK